MTGWCFARTRSKSAYNEVADLSQCADIVVQAKPKELPFDKGVVVVPLQGANSTRGAYSFPCLQQAFLAAV